MKTRNWIQKRFRELVCLEALDRATPNEIQKLDRYQCLRRLKPSQEEVQFIARQDYQLRLFRKAMGALRHQSPVPQRIIDLLNTRFWELV